MNILEELGEAISPEGVSVADLLLAITLVLVALPVARLVERFSRAVMRRIPSLPPESVAVIAHGSRYLTLFLLASLGLNLVGVQIGWTLGLAILAVIVVILTLRPLVANSAAGFLLKSRPSFAVGDEVKLSGHIGEVLSISARTTILRTRDGLRVHIPNTEVLDNEIVVFTAFDTRRLSVELNVDQHCDLEAVTQALIGAAESTPMVRREPPPKVHVSDLSNGALGLVVQFWFEPRRYTEREASNAVNRSVYAALRDAGIELLPPLLRLEATDPLLEPGASLRQNSTDRP